MILYEHFYHWTIVVVHRSFSLLVLLDLFSFLYSVCSVPLSAYFRAWDAWYLARWLWHSIRHGRPGFSFFFQGDCWIPVMRLLAFLRHACNCQELWAFILPRIELYFLYQIDLDRSIPVRRLITHFSEIIIIIVIIIT